VTLAAMLADDDTDKGSPVGLLVVLALCIAVYLLFRSMNRHMRNLPSTFDPPPVDSPAASDLSAAASYSPAADEPSPVVLTPGLDDDGAPSP
jgi:hypothetical protein